MAQDRSSDDSTHGGDSLDDTAALGDTAVPADALSDTAAPADDTAAGEQAETTNDEPVFRRKIVESTEVEEALPVDGLDADPVQDDDMGETRGLGDTAVDAPARDNGRQSSAAEPRPSYGSVRRPAPAQSAEDPFAAFTKQDTGAVDHRELGLDEDAHSGTRADVRVETMVRNALEDEDEDAFTSELTRVSNEALTGADPEKDKGGVRDRTDMAEAVRAAILSEGGQFVIALFLAAGGLSVLLLAWGEGTQNWWIASGIATPITLLIAIIAWRRWQGNSSYSYRVLSSLNMDAEDLAQDREQRRKEKIERKIRKLEQQRPGT